MASRKSGLRSSGTFVFFSLAPAVSLIVVFFYLSVIFCFVVSFFRWNMLTPPKWLGFGNYISMFSDPDFWNSVKVTFVYAFWAVPFCIGLGLVLGLLLKYVTFGRSFFRIMFFIPVIISMAVATYSWSWILNAEVGLLNTFLYETGLVTRGHAPHWMGWVKDSGGGAMAAILIVGIWKRVGYNAVIFLAGLDNIPSELYEAAVIEGASAAAKFRCITWPLLSPTTFFVTILQFISALKVSVSPLLMTDGGPIKSTEVLVLYVYHDAFVNFKMGSASTAAVFIFFLILAVTMIQFRFIERKVHYR